MKLSNASADIAPMTKTKNPSNKYFKPRSGRSAQRGSRKLRPKILRPSFHRSSENVPTGQSHAQKAFFSRRLINRKANNNTMAAGWIAGTRPVSRKYLEFIRPAMGSHPSTTDGRDTYSILPPPSK